MIKPQNTPKIAVWLFLAMLILSIPIYAAAAGFSAKGGQIAIASHTVEIDAETDGNIITVVGNRNSVQTVVEPQAAAQQGRAWLWLIILTGLGLAVVGVWHLLMSGAIYNFVDMVLYWRKS